MINFLRNLFGVSIRSKVIKAIESKISEVEKVYKTEMDVAHLDYKDQIASVKNKYEDIKEKITERNIDKILSKFI
jgi:hypothetical protein